MHSLKKALTLFLVLALIVQVLPLSIFAVDTAARGLLNQEQKNAASKEQVAKENESKQQSQTVVGEMTDLRSETEKHFRLDDGSFIAVDYGMPVHFTEDGGNHWKEIDNTLVLSQNSAAGKQQAIWQNVGESSYTAKNGNNSHSFASDLRSGTLFTAQTDSYGLRMSLTDSNTQGESLASVDEAMDAKIAEQVKDGKAIESTEAVKVTEASASVEETEAVASVEETEAVASVKETEAVASVEETEAVASVEETEAVAVETKLVEVSEQFAFDSVAEISYPVRTAAGSADVSVKNPVASMIQNHFPGLNTGYKNEAVSLEEQIMPKKLEADVLYRNVYQDVDLRYALYGYNVKETIVVNRARQDYVFPFYLDLKDLTPVQMEDGSVELRNQKGEVVYLIPAPYMVDANGAESFDVAYKLAQSKSGAWQLTVVADEKWINDKERTFPVEIDPTLIDEIHSSDILKRCVADGDDPEKYISKTNLVCGYHPTYGQTEVYFKTASLPDVPRGSEVVNAFFGFYQNDYRPSNTTGKVNLSVKPCLSAISNYKTLTWQGRPSLGSTLDYTVAGNNTIAKYHKWDVTSEAKKWYSNPATNYGLAMTSDANSSNKRRVWFSYDTVLFYVTYRDMTGIEGYYTYQTTDAGRAGMAYISDYTGALTTVTPLVSYASTVNPFTLSVIYNSSYFKGEGPDYVSVPQNLGYSMTMGSGMKLSIMQTVAYVDLQDESQDSGTTRYIKYTDGDGTEHYFAKDLSKDSTGAYYYDEDGLGLKITEYVSGYFRMEDDKGNKMYFVHGFLTIIMDANGNSINVYYSDVNGNWEEPGYPNDTHKRIHHITQKNNGQAAITVATFAYATVAEQKNTLTSVTDAARNVYTFNYGCHKLRSIDRNGSAYAEFIHPYNCTTNRFVNPVIGLKDSVNNYAIGFNYTDSRIANYFEVANATNATGTSKDNGKWTSFSIGNGSRGAGVTISRVLGEKTIYTDWGIDHNPNTAADNLTTVYLFDNAGRTVNAYSTDNSSEIIGASNAVYTNVSGTDRRKNRTLTASGIGVSAMSYLLNGSFERTDFAWTLSNPSGTSSKICDISSDTAELARTGNKALKLYGGSSGTFTASHDTARNLINGQTYTASVYVNTSKATIGSSAAGIHLEVTDNNGNTFVGENMKLVTDGAVDNGWYRISVSFTAKQTCKHTVKICSSGVKKSVYFDDFQIETGSAPSNYNLLQNGGLLYWRDTWKNESGSDAAFVGGISSEGNGQYDYSLSINGNPDAVKYITQTVTVAQPGTQTYVLSGWAKANAVPDNVNPEKGKDETDEAYRQRLAKDTDKSFGLRAVLTYVDNTKEYFYAPFNADVTDWQFVSLAIVPKKQEKKVSTIQVYCVYEKNANTAYFDNLSLVKEVAQTMKYDKDGNLVSVQSSGTKEETTTYENGNLIKVVTGGSGTFNYTYDNKHNLTDAANSVVKEHYTYNAAGNLIATKLTKKEGSSTEAQTIHSNRTYTNKENLVASVTDANGNTVTYAYGTASSKMFGQPTLTTNAKNTSVVTSYDDEGRVTNSYISGNVAVPRAYNEKGQLSEMHRGGYIDGTTTLQKYRFTYDPFGETTKITLGLNNEYTLAKYSYADRGGLLKKVEYGNGQSVSYNYDNYGRAAQTDTSSGDRYTYTYTGDGQLYAMKDVSGKLLYQYNYDTLGRLIGSTMKSNGVLSLQTSHRYDENNRMVNQSWSMGGKTYQESYTYDDSNGRLAKKTLTLPGNIASAITLKYDSLSRLYKIESPISVIYYNFADAQNRAKGGTTGLVSAMSVNPKQSGSGVFDRLYYKYQYDELGNITQIQELKPNDSVKETTTYSYDVQSQMTKAVSSVNGTWEYTYDAFGNIRKKTHGNETINYTYDDAAWVDLLTGISVSKNGTTTTGSYTYDGAGNPTKYYNPCDRATWTMTWKNARELSKATKSGTTLEFDYDVNGLRTYKKVGSVQHDYLYASGQLLRETYKQNGTTYTLDFLYDASGRPYMLNLSKSGSQSGTAVYYYLLNLQGDVVGMTDTTGKLVAEYSYDPFGNSNYAQNSEIGRINPLRYRGYYYDSETGFYYLQSRYYDPALGRFINADNYASTGQGFLGYNMFAYCNNSPVNTADPAGNVCCSILDEPGMLGGRGRSNPSHPTCASVPTHTHEFRDVTEEVDAALKDAMWSGYITNWFCGNSALLYLSKLETFRNQVDHRAPWDIKREYSWENTIGTPFPGKDVLVLYHGVTLTPENLGNVTYGVIGRSYGIDILTLLGGSYVAAGFPTEGSALENEIIVDQPWIYLGYDAFYPILYNKYYGDGG